LPVESSVGHDMDPFIPPALLASSVIENQYFSKIMKKKGTITIE
jgi:hypothetical protein